MRNAFLAVFALLCALPDFIAAQPPKKDEGPASTEAEFERQYQERIKKDILNGVYIPKNLDDAMSQLDRITSPESQAKFRALPEDSVCVIMHHRLGQWIILNWGFYGGSRLSHYLRSAGVTYPDDMADFVMLAYHRRLNGKPYTVKEFAVRFREQRKKEFESEKKQGKVLHEEVRKRNKDGN